MKCTRKRSYDSSCINPYIIFGDGARIVPEPNNCQPLRFRVLGVGSDSGEAAKTASESVS